MEIALITDTHHGVRGDLPLFHDYQKKFLDDIFFPYLDEHHITRVIHLGDLYDRRKYINYLTAKSCRESFLTPLASRGIDVDIIAGNHDLYYKNINEVSSLHELVRPYNFEIHIDPVEITCGSQKILLLPWICDSNREKTMGMIDNSRANIILGHLELSGFEMYRGLPNDHGMSRDVFKRFDFVGSGHYHHKSSSGNIHYLGATHEMTWADYNDPRGFHIFDTVTRELKFIRNPHRMFHMVTYDDSDESKVDLEKDYSYLEDCYVKVVSVGKKNSFLFDEFLRKLESASPTDITVIEDVVSFQDAQADTEINQAEDTKTIFRKYINGLQINLDQNRLIDTVETIYAQAMALNED